MMWLLLLLFIPFGFGALAIHQVNVWQRQKVERDYAPFTTIVMQYASEQGLTCTVFPLYNRRSRNAFYKSLPSGLPRDRGRPRIPMYELNEQYHAEQRVVYQFTETHGDAQMRTFVVPFFRERNSVFPGVCYAAVNIPTSMHWLKLQTDIGPLNPGQDFDLESVAFNHKYQLKGSNDTLLTEVFDPILIDQFNAKRGGTVYVRVRTNFAECAERGVLTTSLIADTRSTLRTIQQRFLGAYQGYPEPTATEK